VLNEEKWQAVVNCGKKYDGMFYNGVVTTGIFCRPSCKAKNPLKKNTIFFDSILTPKQYREKSVVRRESK